MEAFYKFDPFIYINSHLEFNNPIDPCFISSQGQRWRIRWRKPGTSSQGSVVYQVFVGFSQELGAVLTTKENWFPTYIWYMSPSPLYLFLCHSLFESNTSMIQEDEYWKGPEAFTTPQETGPLEFTFSVPPTRSAFLFPSPGTWVSFLTGFESPNAAEVIMCIPNKGPRGCQSPPQPHSGPRDCHVHKTWWSRVSKGFL